MDLDSFRQELQTKAKENRLAFEGQYREEIQGLLGLSREDLDQITPSTTDLETYDQLITVVKKASAANISKAELKNRVMELGEVAISISKRVPKLAALFI